MDACRTSTSPQTPNEPDRRDPSPQTDAAPSLSLVLPAYNEEQTIEQAIREADEALAALTTDYEILVVDDGSSDETAAIVEQQARRRVGVRLLRQPRNLGYGAALRRGFEAAGGQLIAFTDADCQFDLRELDRLMLLAGQYDIACGYRIDRQDPWYRKIYSAGYNTLVRLLLGTGVRDCDCALKVFRREVVKSIPIETNGFFVNAELLTKARLRGDSIVEVGVTHRPRPRGQSTVSALHAVPVAATLVRFWWQTVLFPRPPRCEQHHVERLPWLAEFAALLLLCVLGLVLLLPNLSYPMLEPDETRYAQIALNMVESGNWVTPTLEGQAYLDKPPLLYWMTAASYELLGKNEMAARFPCAMSAFLAVLATYLVGRRLVGVRAAWCAAVALLLCGGFVLSGRFLLMDGPLTLFTTLALLAAYLACCGERVRMGWWLTAAVACALGVLTKGPVAVVLCLPPLVAARWLGGSGARLRIRHWAAFAATALLIAMPWFLAIAAAHHGFSGYFFWKHHVVRFLNAFDHQEPWWFYLPVLLVGMFPASVLLGPTLMFLFGRNAGLRQERSKDLGFLMLSGVWIVLFFSLSSCKLPTYILPAVPTFCLLLGTALDRSALTPGPRSGVSELLWSLPRPTGIAVLVVAVLAAVIDLAVVKHRTIGLLFSLSVLLGAAVGLVVLWRIRWRRSHAAWACCAAMCLTVVAFTFADFLPAVSRFRSIHREAAALHASHGAAPVVYYKHSTNSAEFHLKPGQFVYFRDEQLRDFKDFVRKCPEVVIVVPPETARQVERSLGSAFEFKPAASGFVYLLTSRNASAARIGEGPRPPLR